MNQPYTSISCDDTPNSGSPCRDVFFQFISFLGFVDNYSLTLSQLTDMSSRVISKEEVDRNAWLDSIKELPTHFSPEGAIPHITTQGYRCLINGVVELLIKQSSDKRKRMSMTKPHSRHYIIQAIYVDPQFRRQGLATWILQTLERSAYASGQSILVQSVTTFQMKELMKKLGYYPMNDDYFKPRDELSREYMIDKLAIGGWNYEISLQASNIYSVKSNIFRPLYPGQRFLLDNQLLLEITNNQPNSALKNHYDAKRIEGNCPFQYVGDMSKYNVV